MSIPDLPREPSRPLAPSIDGVGPAAAAWARAHRISSNGSAAPYPAQRLDRCTSLIGRAHDRYVQMSDGDEGLAQAGEWLVDNYHVVAQASRQIREDMPMGYYRRLPKLSSRPFSGHPRVYALAHEILLEGHGLLGADRVIELVQGYQLESVLTMGEVWALPTMLRLRILELLAAALARTFGLEDEGEQPLPIAGVPDELMGEGAVGSYIRSLHMLATQDWDTFFEKVSVVHQVLCTDPAETYQQMDFQSRDRYRDAIEELAWYGERDEAGVAREAVRLAEDAASEPGALRREGHVGYYLIDDGRAELEGRIGYRPPWNQRVRRWVHARGTAVYLGAIGLLTVLATLGLFLYAWRMGGTGLQLLGVALISSVSVSVLAVDVVNLVITRLIPPHSLPKLDFRNGVPEECRTMVVIPGLIARQDDADSLLAQIELHYLSGADPNLGYGLLTDFADAPQEIMPEDDLLVDRAIQGIGQLNEKHGGDGHGPFYLFHRRRLWNPAEDCWMGWERKRGKLSEFNCLLAGRDDTTFEVQVGDSDFLNGVRYVITLDADTLMPRDAAKRMIGTLAHPLNRAVFAEDGSGVVAGYTVLQPRTEVKPSAAIRSPFTEIFSGDVGIDLYTRAVSDVYQDLFHDGIYVGKGIYDVVAFERSLGNRVPDNALLSHDLFEGAHGRCGLVSDIRLYEDYPPTYLSYAHRLHRWVRGDWQLIPWLGRRVPLKKGGATRNPLSLIDRWRILDNLRRSLRQPFSLLLLLAGWAWFPGSPSFWTVVALAGSGIALINGALVGLIVRLGGGAQRRLMRSLRLEAARWALSLAFLPYEALLMTDAITATLVRMAITREHLLQWTTAAHTIRVLGRERRVAVTWGRMGGASLYNLAIAAVLALTNRAALWLAAPFLLVWLLSPQIAHWIDRPRTRPEEPLKSGQHRRLRRLARRTWLYFEHFVGPEDHWLPPDHFQESPRGQVAHRTSPTNIGVLLLSTLAARELGYIGNLELAIRCELTLSALGEMEHYRGHLLNWYDTRSLEPLSPRYVSTVDSGNLAACLLVLRQGLLSVLGQPAFRWWRLRCLLDSVGVLREHLEEFEAGELREAIAPLVGVISEMRREIRGVDGDPKSWASLLAKVGNDVWRRGEGLLLQLVEAHGDAFEPQELQGLRTWSERIRQQLYDMQREMDTLLPWMSLLEEMPDLPAFPDIGQELHESWRGLLESLPPACSLEVLPDICQRARARLNGILDLLERDPNSGNQVYELRSWCERLRDALEEAERASTRLIGDLQSLADRAERHFHAMDFAFLLDPARRTFHIGYNVADERLDSGHYDLLASEARIASLIAIAKGDVAQDHWLHLGRPLALAGGTRMLLSWNGSMFEYLMPALLMRTYEPTLLSQSYLAVIRKQMDYAHQKGVPWGISESGYYSFDANRNYQYRGFGVPGVGRKRGLEDDLVIAPYASLLALPIRPLAVMDNLDDLVAEGMLGRYGLYEAIDYTHSRLPLRLQKAPVRSFMAHHQGMILVSLANCLANQAIVRMFHADPMVQSVELLLQERVPRAAPTAGTPESSLRAARAVAPRVDLGPWRPRADAPLPQVHYLSNGDYGLLITADGGGYTRWGGLDLTRWRSDPTLDDWGQWLYLQDLDSGGLWSATRQPTATDGEDLDVHYYAHKAEFRRRDDGISLLMEVAIAPEDDVEIRRLTLTNHENRRRRLRIASYGELVLAPPAEDRRHQAFNKLFIESEYIAGAKVQLFRRRLRKVEEQPVHVAHAIVLNDEADGEFTIGRTECEGDRVRFLGRGGTPRRPVALEADGGGLANSAGATLDPVMCISQEIELGAHGRAQLAFLTSAARSRQEVVSLVERYADLRSVERAFARAASRSERELHGLGLDASDLEQIQRLLSLLVYPYRGLRARPDLLRANEKGQSGLWEYGLSGDYPLLLVRIAEQEHMPLVRELLRAHRFWRNRGLMIDLVILNERDSGYAGELDAQLRSVISRAQSDVWLGRRGGIFLLRADQMTSANKVLIQVAARAILDAQKGPMAAQLSALIDRPTYLPQLMPQTSVAAEAEIPPVPRPEQLLFDNGLGGFTKDGQEYVIYLVPGTWTPAPWINVIANPSFGFLVSEAGAGYTWSVNSGENRLTPWQNDPVRDEPGEAIYLRDEETAEVWSPTPAPARADAPYLVRHGAGYSVFHHASHGLRQRVRMFAAPDDPVKLIRLRLENRWGHTRRITATYFAEWVLGVSPEDTRQYLVPDYDAETQTVLVRNPYSEEFGRREAFLASNMELHGLTTDRTEFLGRRGSRAEPAALRRVGLGGQVEAGRDPCAAVQVHVDLMPGEAKEITFLLGQGACREEALGLVSTYRDDDRVEEVWDEVRKRWDDLLSSVRVDTPDEAMDLLLNRWLLYQTLSCRVWGRSALCQSSGAFGFRDQLQDVLSLMHAAPGIARAHILRAARHQFEAGDVLHWWHPPAGRGVRTRISDDLLWLPFATAEYVGATGDRSVLHHEIPFLRGERLREDEGERYGHWSESCESRSLYEHCRRAIEEGATSGRHGLPLMGSGDWNDGMNRVGIGGRGESVWLAWFLAATLERFAPLSELMGDHEYAEACRQRAKALRAALDESAWDGRWYRRAYYDDGTPLGSAESLECKIDSVAQSWSVLSHTCKDAQLGCRQMQAMQSLYDELVRADDRLALLLTPPFDEAPQDPGYIKGYPPGVRENGGQYTHAALWAAWAFAELGQGDRAHGLFQMLNPIAHAASPEGAKRYRVEPYVVAADVYSEPPHVGRGGWTWYTGSAGWMYRLGLEGILGLRRRGRTLEIDPCVPPEWRAYSITYRYRSSQYIVEIRNPGRVCCGVGEIRLDGRAVSKRRIPLLDDGKTHRVEVMLRGQAPREET